MNVLFAIKKNAQQQSCIYKNTCMQRMEFQARSPATARSAVITARARLCSVRTGYVLWKYIFMHTFHVPTCACYLLTFLIIPPLHLFIFSLPGFPLLHPLPQMHALNLPIHINMPLFLFIIFCCTCLSYSSSICNYSSGHA